MENDYSGGCHFYDLAMSKVIDFKAYKETQKHKRLHTVSHEYNDGFEVVFLCPSNSDDDFNPPGAA